MMKNILCYGLMFVICFSTVGYASNKTIIYGLDQAARFNGTPHQSVYIQAGSFSDKSNAIIYLNYVRSKTTYPVELVHLQRLTVVMIGPIMSADEVRKTGRVCKKSASLDYNRVVLNQPRQKNKSVHVPAAGGFINSEGDGWVNLTQAPITTTANRSVCNVTPTHVVATLTAGPDFMQKDQSQTIAIIPPFENFYQSNGHVSTVADVGVFVGIERLLTEGISGQLGIAGYWDAGFAQEGTTWQFDRSLFDNLTYNYDIHHTRLMLASKLLGSVPSSTTLHPYATLELGAAFNRASGYNEVSFTPGVFPMAPYANNNESSFAYGVGAGIDYDFNQHMRLGVGYQFSDLGAVTLGSSPVTTTNDTLKVNHLYANQLRFQLTYIL